MARERAGEGGGSQVVGTAGQRPGMIGLGCWQNGVLDQRACEELVGGEATMSTWGQTVESLKCQAKDSDCVLDRAGFCEWSLAVLCCGHSSATDRLEKVQEEAGSLGETGTIVQTRGSEGGR